MALHVSRGSSLINGLKIDRCSNTYVTIDEHASVERSRSHCVQIRDSTATRVDIMHDAFIADCKEHGLYAKESDATTLTMRSNSFIRKVSV